MSTFDKLMKFKKKDLCGMIIAQNADKVEMDKYIKQLEMEATRNDLEYAELLKYKNEVINRLRNPEEGIFDMEDVTDLAGNKCIVSDDESIKLK